MKTMQKTVSAFLTFAMLLCMMLTVMPTVFANESSSNSVPSGASTSSVTSSSANQTTGAFEILGYSVQDAAGNEIQKVTPGTKCRIVVAVRDGRFTSAPTKYDSYGNTVNVKITSTDSFASPSFGDIKQTNIRMTDKGLSLIHI